VHVVDPDPVNELVPHESVLIDAAIGAELIATGSTVIDADLVIDPCVAVSLAVCADDTADAVAENATLVVPAGTVIDDGTVTALVLLAKLTTIPPLDASADKVTVQLSIAGPMMVELTHVNPDSEAVELEPFPWSFTVPEMLFELVVMAFTLSTPVESVVEAGL
jgi:hypothetical protein